MNFSTIEGGSERKIGVGLIGSGTSIDDGHLLALGLLPQFEAFAVHLPHRDKAESLAQKFSVSAVLDTVDELVAHREVELVVVLNTTPNHQNAVAAAIAAGKHVLCDWPLTIDTPTARSLLAKADAVKVRHVVALQRRLSPHIRYLRDLLENGYVGDMRSVRMHVSTGDFQAIRAQAMRWTVAEKDFSHVVALYAGHFLDMLFEAVGQPTQINALTVNQIHEVTIRETFEKIETTAPDQLVLHALLPGNAVLSVHVEGGKRNGSGLQIDISGDEGDIRLSNSSPFGGSGDGHILLGAHGDGLPLTPLSIPNSYDWLPPSSLPPAVLELGNLYVTFARDLQDGSHNAPTFDDALWLHEFFDKIEESSLWGTRKRV